MGYYWLYGIRVKLPEMPGDFLPYEQGDIDLHVRPSHIERICNQDDVSWFHTWYRGERSCWIEAGQRGDGWYRLRFKEAEFAVSRRGDIIEFDDSHTSLETIRHYLLNQVIPMAMNRGGKESLHASSILSVQGVIAFIGNGGYGKSTISASLIRQGFPQVSDDVVPLVAKQGRIWTRSGAGEIALWPRARRLLNKWDDNPGKIRFPLSPEQHRHGEFPLTRLYFLRPGEKQSEIRIEPMCPREVLMELVRAAHRMDLRDTQMIEHQFRFLATVTGLVPARVLRYPARIPSPEKICDAVLADETPGVVFLPTTLRSSNCAL